MRPVATLAIDDEQTRGVAATGWRLGDEVSGEVVVEEFGRKRHVEKKAQARTGCNWMRMDSRMDLRLAPAGRARFFRCSPVTPK